MVWSKTRKGKIIIKKFVIIQDTYTYIHKHNKKIILPHIWVDEVWYIANMWVSSSFFCFSYKKFIRTILLIPNNNKQSTVFMYQHNMISKNMNETCLWHIVYIFSRRIVSSLSLCYICWQKHFSVSCLGDNFFLLFSETIIKKNKHVIIRYLHKYLDMRERENKLRRKVFQSNKNVFSDDLLFVFFWT